LTNATAVNSAVPHNAYVIFCLAASFYLYEFILQVAPSVMAAPMMSTFHVTAEGFGIIAAFYFYAYAPMQIPSGVLFDRYGPRKLMTGAIVLCALGSIFFALTDSVITACIGRLLIGFGSAFSFIGVLVLTARWFPPYHFALLAGIAQLMSSVGAIFGGAPLAALVDRVGWRQASFILGGIGFVLAAVLWSVVRDFPHQATQSRPSNRFRDEWKRLAEVCRHSYTWIIAAYSCCVWTPIAVFAVLWGVPYLQEKYQVSVIVASGLCSIIWIGIGVGSPLLGWVSDKFASRRLALTISAVFGLVATVFVLYVPNVSLSYMYVVLFCFGLGAGGQTVSFAVVRDNNPAHLVGTASGFNNFAVLVGGAVFQPLVGILLHHSHAVRLVNNVPVYSVSGYQLGLSVLPCCYALSFILAYWMSRESHPYSRG